MESTINQGINLNTEVNFEEQKDLLNQVIDYLESENEFKNKDAIFYKKTIESIFNSMSKEWKLSDKKSKLKIENYIKNIHHTIQGTSLFSLAYKGIEKGLDMPKTNMGSFLGLFPSFAILTSSFVVKSITNHNEFKKQRFSEAESILSQNKNISGKKQVRILEAYNLKLSAILNVQETLFSKIIKFNFLSTVKNGLNFVMNICSYHSSDKNINKFLRKVDNDLNKLNRSEDIKTKQKEHIRDNFNQLYDKVMASGIKDLLNEISNDKINQIEKIKILKKEIHEEENPKNIILKKQKIIKSKNKIKKINETLQSISYLDNQKKKSEKREIEYSEINSVAKYILNTNNTKKIRSILNKPNNHIYKKIALAEKIEKDIQLRKELIGHKPTVKKLSLYSKLMFSIIKSENKEEAEENLSLILKDYQNRDSIVKSFSDYFLPLYFKELKPILKEERNMSEEELHKKIRSLISETTEEFISPSKNKKITSL